MYVYIQSCAIYLLLHADEASPAAPAAREGAREVAALTLEPHASMQGAGIHGSALLKKKILRALVSGKAVDTYAASMMDTFLPPSALPSKDDGVKRQSVLDLLALLVLY